jgi:hypothetical protein
VWRNAEKPTSRQLEKKEIAMNNNFEFEVRTLDVNELEMVSGGCTCGTVSVCHVDGTDEPVENQL